MSVEGWMDWASLWAVLGIQAVQMGASVDHLPSTARTIAHLGRHSCQPSLSAVIGVTACGLPKLMKAQAKGLTPLIA